MLKLYSNILNYILEFGNVPNLTLANVMIIPRLTNLVILRQEYLKDKIYY